MSKRSGRPSPRGIWPKPCSAGTLLELFALTAIAEMRATQGQAERAAALASLVLHHDNAEKRDKADAERLLATLSEQLAPEELEAAIEQGRELQLAEVVEEILAPSPGS